MLKERGECHPSLVYPFRSADLGAADNPQATQACWLPCGSSAIASP
jgi:hypothetical protein